MTPCQGNTFIFRFTQQLPRLRLRPLKGIELTWSPSRAHDLHGELLPERKRKVFPRQGVIDLPSRQINDFSQKGNRKKLS